MLMWGNCRELRTRPLYLNAADRAGEVKRQIFEVLQRRLEPNAIDRAWGGALVLILLVMLFYASARILARLFAPKGT